jgi:hypothetical protein
MKLTKICTHNRAGEGVGRYCSICAIGVPHDVGNPLAGGPHDIDGPLAAGPHDIGRVQLPGPGCKDGVLCRGG